ncbi:MAG: hypothetical protein KC592_09535 [Nitrospira sp.]|nr:hypothetical protein [Nitrospira sp.]
MKAQSCYASPWPKTGNPNLSTPWGRYRHGCDPPDYHEQSKASAPTHPSNQNFSRSHQLPYFWFLLSSVSPFHNIHIQVSTQLSIVHSAMAHPPNGALVKIAAFLDDIPSVTRDGLYKPTGNASGEGILTCK